MATKKAKATTQSKPVKAMAVKAMAKTQTNKKYLPGYKLDDRLKYSHDLQAAVKDTDIIFIAVPGLAFRETLKSIAPFISGQSIVSLTKGMEKDTLILSIPIIFPQA